MKRLTLLGMLFCMLITSLHAQLNDELSPNSEVLTVTKMVDSKTVTWLGLDFSQAVFTPGAGFKSPAFNNTVLTRWNDIVKYEPNKFPLERYLGVESVQLDFSVVDARNDSLKLRDQVFNESSKKLTPEIIASVIREYPRASGTGVVVIVDSYEKKKLRGTYWVVFFDRATGDVISTRPVVGKPSGIGLRNFWSNALARALKAYN